MKLFRLFWLLALLASGLEGTAAEPQAPTLVFACQADNDLYSTVIAQGIAAPREELPLAAVQKANPGAGVLILADGYPERPATIPPEAYRLAAEKHLRLFVEFPAELPGIKIQPRRQAHVERVVVASDFFGPALPRMRILAVNGLAWLPVAAEKPHLVAARVAGFDQAVYGLPKETFPILFEPPQGNLLVATTQLSRFIRGRYAPQDAWAATWNGILAWLQPDAKIPKLAWTPAVRPAFSREALLPDDAERQALRRGLQWFVDSKLLLDQERLGGDWKKLQPSGGLMATHPDGLAPTPPPEAPVGDGSFGILEAPLAVIGLDGRQKLGVCRRGDCTAESAMALAFGGQLFQEPQKTAIAKNLLDFYCFTSTARKNERADPQHGAYGMVAWGIDSPSWYVANYGDDNARFMLGGLAVAALAEDRRWDEAMAMCLLANLRTSGRYGFRNDRLDLPELKRGWRPFFNRPFVSYSPHMESYLWACYLWAYDKTGFELFYTRAETAIRMTMAQYPDGWRWTNGLAQEKARMLLPLAWLVRVKDTPEHRQWLRQAVDGVAALQDPCGAIREELGLPGKGMFPPPRSNEAYGGAEASLIQQNGEPVADLLYTTNFAFLGLHEAAAAGDPAAREAEEKLAHFLCRIQARSEAHPELDGGWFRAFDFQRWESWASNADAGWGAWAIESGWTQGWITSVLALRQMQTSYWDLTAKSRIKIPFDRLRPEMLPDEALAPVRPIEHAAFQRPVSLRTRYAPQYSGGGDGAIVDGFFGDPDDLKNAWQGYEGTDLEATLDLGKAIPVHKVSVSCLQMVAWGIYAPVKVECSTSADGQAYVVVKSVEPGIPAAEAGPVAKTVAIPLDGHPIRYLRIRAVNLGKIPAGNPAAGKPAWLFVDEVQVE